MSQSPTHRYLEALDNLRQLGSQFSRENPVLAPELGEASADPDVERVLEGIAYASGQIRGRLDEDLGEFVQSYADALWPHFLRPVPSMSIVEFEAAPGVELPEPRPIPRETTRLATTPVDGTTCSFRTGHDVLLRPVAVESAHFEDRGRRADLEVELCLLGDVPVRALDLDSLRFYLHADYPAAASLFAWLVGGCDGISLVTTDEGGRDHRLEVRGQAGPPVRAAGVSRDEALLPYPARSFDGYRLLQEYFAIPQRFLFVDVLGLRALEAWKTVDRFRIVFHGRQRAPQGVRVDAGTFRLHCTPVVNLFESTTDPLLLDHRDATMLLRPSGLEPSHYEVHSIERVQGLPRQGGPRRHYAPFGGFRSDPETAGRHYQLRRKVDPDGSGMLSYLTVVTESAGSALPEEEWLSIDAICTNARLGEALRVGDISVATEDSPDFAVFQNLTPVSRSVRPPLGAELLGIATRHSLLQYAPLASTDSLRTLLSLYDFHASEDRQSARALELLLRSVVSIESRPESRRLQVAPVRGMHTRIVLDESGFLGEGGLFVFASVLEEVLSLASTLNVYTRLTAVGANEREEYSWPARIANRIIP
ncbi:MAG: type VI secretion system baseplate subunit TssF [Myxococcota bacterium]